MSSASPRVPAALIVEDHESLRQSLIHCLEPFADRILAASSVTEGLRLIEDEKPGLILTDVRLPDGSGLEVARAASMLAPIPCVIAMSGHATAEESFRLAQFGVRGYLSKPLRLEELTATVQRALTEPPSFDPLLRASVGKQALHELEERVRHTLIDEALARAGGKKSHAAALLSVSRQLLQHMMRGRRDASSDEPDSK
jgi:two-component system response regulator RegA